MTLCTMTTKDPEAVSQRSHSESDASQPFPPLPVELVQDILETAANVSKSTALALVLVSRAVHHWIMPILYRTVDLYDCAQSQSFSRLLSTDTAGHVQGLWLHHDPLALTSDSGWQMEHKKRLQIIKRIPNLRRLVAYFFHGVDENATGHSGTASTPWEVVLCLDRRYHIHSYSWLQLPILENVTHLFLAASPGSWGGIIASILLDDVCSYLPKLTHLGLMLNAVHFTERWTVFDIDRILSSSRQLELFLLDFCSESPPDTPISDWDPRTSFGSARMNLASIGDARLLVSCDIWPAHFKDCWDEGRDIWSDLQERLKNWREYENYKGEGEDEGEL